MTEFEIISSGAISEIFLQISQIYAFCIKSVISLFFFFADAAMEYISKMYLYFCNVTGYISLC